LLKLRRAGFDAFLVGEYLMLAPDPGVALCELLGQPVTAPSVNDGDATSLGNSQA
jgi:hypothetical protein